MLTYFSRCLRRTILRACVAGFVGVVCIFGVVCAPAQTVPSAAAISSAADHGRILLVLPFDNRTGQPSLEWIREAAAELLSSRFDSAGFAPMSRADRMYALDHLGLPQGFQPSRASSLKLAQTLDADSIVVGSYQTDRGQIVASAQIVDVPHLRMGPAVTARGDMSDMIDVFDSLAWKLTKQLDPSFSVAEETFVAAGKSIRLDAFEQYIRGITEPDESESVRHLGQAVKVSPDLSPAWMALGREEFTGQEYEQAASAFSKVDHRGPDGLEAGFYRGMALLFSGQYALAEREFADVARVLPLAEVVNNEAVAMSRQGHDGTSLFIQAAANDPTQADYHFNLAVSLNRHGNRTAALNELAQSLKLRPNDSEAQALLVTWKAEANGSGANGVVSPVSKSRPGAPSAVTGTGSAATGSAVAVSAVKGSVDPLERIVRTFDASAFRQAAMMMDQLDASRLATLAPMEQAQKLCTQARGYLDRGLLLEAERLYQAAVADDAKDAEAHAGLAEVRERSGDSDGAGKEANTALKLQPTNAAAQEILRQIAARNGLNK